MFWIKNGVMISENGQLINCNTCPCQQFVCPCGNWYTEIQPGYQVLYSVNISLYVSKLVKWYQDYGEGEAERYQSLQQIDVTASLANIPVSDILQGFCFEATSIIASDRWEYKYYSSNQLVSDEITENSLDTSRCNGCPTDDPEEAPADDNKHSLSFTCNNNCENFRFGLSTTAYSCHGTHYEESLWGVDQWEMPVQIGVNVNHLVFPSRNPNLTFREIPGKGYVLQGDTLELSYHDGDPNDDNYIQQNYRHVLSFTPQLT